MSGQPLSGQGQGLGGTAGLSQEPLLCSLWFKSGLELMVPALLVLFFTNSIR